MKVMIRKLRAAGKEKTRPDAEMEIVAASQNAGNQQNLRIPKSAPKNFQ